MSQVSFAKWDHTRQTLRPYAPYPSFRVGIQIGASCRQTHNFHTGVLEHPAEHARIERVTIQDEVPRLLQEAVYAIGEVPSDLSHPSFAWLTGDPCDMYPSCCNIDNEEYVVANQPESAKYLNREEISAGDGSKMRLNDVCQLVRRPRSGAGSSPWARRMFLIVLRATSWLRLKRAPCRRV